MNFENDLKMAVLDAKKRKNFSVIKLAALRFLLGFYKSEFCDSNLIVELLFKSMVQCVRSFCHTVFIDFENTAVIG